MIKKDNDYLKDNIKRCVDYVMSKNDDDKRRIITGMFQYSDYLVNEQLVVQALNDKEKREWFNDDMSKACDLLQERIDKAIDYIMTNHCLYLLDKSIINSKELIDILRGSDKE